MLPDSQLRINGSELRANTKRESSRSGATNDGCTSNENISSIWYDVSSYGVLVLVLNTLLTISPLTNHIESGRLSGTIRP